MSDPHENYTSDWHTPPEWARWAADTMGAIDLDPCAAPAEAHASIAWSNIRAAEQDGLAATWHGRVYVNPPGSNSVRSIRPWWGKAMMHLAAGEIEALVWCFFNWEAAITVRPSPFELDGWLVMPRARVKFIRNGEVGGSPRNRTVFWSSVRPANPPVDSLILRTGPLVADSYEVTT